MRKFVESTIRARICLFKNDQILKQYIHHWNHGNSCTNFVVSKMRATLLQAIKTMRVALLHLTTNKLKNEGSHLIMYKRKCVPASLGKKEGAYYSIEEEMCAHITWENGGVIAKNTRHMSPHTTRNEGPHKIRNESPHKIRNEGPHFVFSLCTRRQIRNEGPRERVNMYSTRL